jgi:hypothetical protein
LPLAIGVLVGEKAHSAALGLATIPDVAELLSCMEVLKAWQATKAFQEADDADGRGCLLVCFFFLALNLQTKMEQRVG